MDGGRIWGGGRTFLQGFLFVCFSLGGGGVEGAVFVFCHFLVAKGGWVGCVEGGWGAGGKGMNVV